MKRKIKFIVSATKINAKFENGLIKKKKEIKFYEGLASSFDLRQAQNQLYAIQNEYLEATLKIIENKINLEILLNKS